MALAADRTVGDEGCSLDARIAMRHFSATFARPWAVVWTALLLGLGPSGPAAGDARADVPPLKLRMPRDDKKKPRKPESDIKPPEPLRPLAPARPTRLPDGLFAGPVAGLGAETELQLTVVEGLIVEAFLRRRGEDLPTFDLRSIGPANGLGLNLRGNAKRENVKVSGEFFDIERGRGTIEGVLGGKRVTGTWLIKRR
jgi:hypothetical protein